MNIKNTRTICSLSLYHGPRNISRSTTNYQVPIKSIQQQLAQLNINPKPGKDYGLDLQAQISSKTYTMEGLLRKARSDREWYNDRGSYHSDRTVIGDTRPTVQQRSHANLEEIYIERTEDFDYNVIPAIESKLELLAEYAVQATVYVAAFVG